MWVYCTTCKAWLPLASVELQRREEKLSRGYDVAVFTCPDCRDSHYSEILPEKPERRWLD